MNDSSIHQEPAVQQFDKPCVVCAEPIKTTASKCIKCGAYQDWRRYLEYFQPWVPWLVAAMSATLAVFTYVSHIAHTPDSVLELSSPHVFNNEARFIVVNAGDRPGVVEQVSVRLRLSDTSGNSYYFQSEHAIPPEQVDIIKPGEQRPYKISLTEHPIAVEYTPPEAGFVKLFRQENEKMFKQMFQREGACRFSIVVRNFRSDRKVIDSPIRCYDLSAYVNNYLVNMDKKNVP